jgi:acyl-ACP thioesterase
MTRRVHLNDVDHTGALRVDAVARLLQDVATDDAHDAGMSGGRGVWVLRRADVEIRRRPVLYDAVTLLTFASGAGPRWAERRTRMTDEHGDVLAEGVAVWVYIDGARGRPLVLGEEFAAKYGEAAAGRKVSGRLHLPPPPADADARPWSLRHADFDVLDHVNNARSLEAVEDELATRLPGHVVRHLTAEYRGTIERGDEVELRSRVGEDGHGAPVLDAWLVVGGEVRASARLLTHLPLH